MILLNDNYKHKILKSESFRDFLNEKANESKIKNIDWFGFNIDVSGIKEDNIKRILAAKEDIIKKAPEYIKNYDLNALFGLIEKYLYDVNRYCTYYYMRDHEMASLFQLQHAFWEYYDIDGLKKKLYDKQVTIVSQFEKEGIAKEVDINNLDRNEEKYIDWVIPNTDGLYCKFDRNTLDVTINIRNKILNAFERSDKDKRSLTQKYDFNSYHSNFNDNGWSDSHYFIYYKDYVRFAKDIVEFGKTYKRPPERELDDMERDMQSFNSRHSNDNSSWSGD